MRERMDCVVVGAGVVGLAVARALALSGREVLVLEQENIIGSHTSSRNSEVVHAGIYYTPDSLKARLCRRGRDLLYSYCIERGLGHSRCGKLIIAVDPDQLEKLEAVSAYAARNDVHDLVRVSGAEIAELEPNVVAIAGLLSPSTGIVDSHALMTSYEGDIENSGGMVVCRSRVERIEQSGGDLICYPGDPDGIEIAARTVINAAGLFAQDLANSTSGLHEAQIPRQHLAKAHYYTLNGRQPFKRLIYPANNKDGGQSIHVTIDLGGQVKFGPDMRWVSTIDYDFDDSKRQDFIAAIKSYYPTLDPENLVPGYTGIRPRIFGPSEETADFRIDGPSVHGVEGLINLFGIESPGLTASMAIGDYVSQMAKTAIRG
ncbi:FAD-dependent oxidoreductase [Sphingobium lactosutens]|nr:FAD-dependent oxidoreductase [Sphingobium lactosutens]